MRAVPLALGLAVLAALAAPATPGLDTRLSGATRATRATRAVAPVPGFVVVVNAANPATSVKKLELVRIFTRKMRAWPGSGLPAMPVDQRDATPARREFLADVMGKDAAAMSAYWQSQVFVGRTTPPPVKATDAEVLAYVATAPGSVGYVTAGAALPSSVKAIPVAD